MRREYGLVESSWNVMAHGDAWEEKWRGNWRMEWVSSTFHTTSEHGVSCITTANAHTSAASSRLNWRPCRFKWTRPFCRKTKSGFCACAITFQTQSKPLDSAIFRPPYGNLSWQMLNKQPHFSQLKKSILQFTPKKVELSNTKVQKNYINRRWRKNICNKPSSSVSTGDIIRIEH
jgi:hypothetical protein